MYLFPISYGPKLRSPTPLRLIRLKQIFGGFLRRAKIYARRGSGPRGVASQGQGGPECCTSPPSAAIFVLSFLFGGRLVELWPRFKDMPTQNCAFGLFWCDFVRVPAVASVSKQLVGTSGRPETCKTQTLPSDPPKFSVRFQWFP